MKRLLIGLSISAALYAGQTAMAADPNFVEADVDVIVTLLGEQPASDNFGWVAEDLDDINNDGNSDFVVTAPTFADGGGNQVGKVYVYSGNNGALLGSQVGVAGELLGFSASLAGDLNDDGVNDYVSGSLQRVVTYSGADHSVIWEVVQPGENFGFDVDTAGDVTGDGVSDIVVGATANGANGSLAGAAYLLSGADGAVVWQFLGAESGDQLGSAVGRIGDVSGDGVPDVVVGARGGGHKDRGIAFALSGVDGAVIYDMKPVGRAAQPLGTFATFHAAGGRDVDGDGVNDIFIGDFGARRGQENPNLGGTNPNSPNPENRTGRAYVFSGADGSRLQVINAENNGDGIGPGRLVDDVDGDGLADIYVASFIFGPNLEGKSYLYSGADLSLIREMTGTMPFAFLGVDALGLRDADGDGLQDYLLTGFGVIHVIAGNP